MTRYVQRSGLRLAACGMSRRLAAEIGDAETSEIEHVGCSNCLMVLVAIFDNTASEWQRRR